MRRQFSISFKASKEKRMRTCDYCSQIILTGGAREEYGVFCSDYCATEAEFLNCCVSDKDVLDFACKIREKNCPACKRNGPIDIRPGIYAKSYFVRLALASRDGMYEENFPELRCGSCDALSSFRSLPKILRNSRFGFTSILLSPQFLVPIPIPRDKVEKCVARKGCGISS